MQMSLELASSKAQNNELRLKRRNSGANTKEEFAAATKDNAAVQCGPAGCAKERDGKRPVLRQSRPGTNWRKPNNCPVPATSCAATAPDGQPALELEAQ